MPNESSVPKIIGATMTKISRASKHFRKPTTVNTTIIDTFSKSQKSSVPLLNEAMTKVRNYKTTKTADEEFAKTAKEKYEREFTKKADGIFKEANMDDAITQEIYKDAAEINLNGNDNAFVILRNNETSLSQADLLQQASKKPDMAAERLKRIIKDNYQPGIQGARATDLEKEFNEET